MKQIFVYFKQRGYMCVRAHVRDFVPWMHSVTYEVSYMNYVLDYYGNYFELY